MALFGQQAIPQGGAGAFQLASPASVLQGLDAQSIGSIPQQSPNPTAGPSGQSPLQLSNSLDGIRRRLLTA
jgi:hypothetical protein